MALRIACDLDGTLADIDTALQEEAERLFGPHVDPREIRLAVPSLAAADAERTATPVAIGVSAPARRPLTSTETRALWSEVRRREDFWLSLREIEPGAVARFAALAGEHRWDVLFITQRPSTAGGTAQRQSQRWLRDYGFDDPSVFVVTGSRGHVAASLGLHALIDDRPEHCLAVRADSAARPVLVWRRAAASVPPRVTDARIDVVSSAGAAFELLVEMTRRAAPPRGFVARLREAIGAS